jgi:hypothetical protein
MIGWLVKRKMKAFESQFEYDMSYARDLYDASPRAFWKFSRVLALSEHHQDVPVAAWFAAKLAATLTEDCGPCTQLVVTMAERQGVSPKTLRAILAGDTNSMPADAAFGYRFANAVLARDISGSDSLRAEIVTQWGRKALVSLALGIASSRVYPNLKYALGYGHACIRVRVAGADTPLDRHATHA